MHAKRFASPAAQVALLVETSTEYGRGLLRGILRWSRLHGPWSLYVSPGHLDQTLPRSKSWKGAGIIARIRSPQMEAMIRSAGLPFVASSLSEARPHKKADVFGEIRTDSKAIATMAFAHLRQSGLRHFAFCGFTGCRWSEIREEVFVNFARQMGCDCPAHRITPTGWLQGSNWMTRWQREQPAAAAWLKALPKPVGVMACNDVCGRAILQACANARLVVPDQVAVVGVDNDEMMCELSSPSLSSVALALDRAGYEAAGLLDALMKGRSKGNKVVWVSPTQVIARQSTDVIGQEDLLVAEALRFIREHARDALNVPDVAGRLGVSRRTLERRFLRAIGRSVLSEILRCRLRHAKQLLEETDLPCHRVAAEAGFGTLKSFTRVFKTWEQTTPGAFRLAATAPTLSDLRPRPIA